jgi:CDP-diacylglycerol--glycerol-3-phosphate 3-phosphatidyltransferase
MILNLSNVLSLSRAGFALAFLGENPSIRFFAILLAMISDFLDGYIARKQRMTTSFGAALDPIMDKFFVFFAGGIFFMEKKLNAVELGAILSRDVSICLFGLFLGLVRGWKGYECKALWWGKLTTIVQFAVLIGLTFGILFPVYVYSAFLLMAALAFIELLSRYRRTTQT